MLNNKEETWASNVTISVLQLRQSLISVAQHTQSEVKSVMRGHGGDLVSLAATDLHLQVAPNQRCPLCDYKVSPFAYDFVLIASKQKPFTRNPQSKPILRISLNSDGF